MKKAIILAAACVVASAAQAQSRNSFLPVDLISDLTVQVSNGGLTYKIDMGANPTFTYQNSVYHINRTFGFWVLSDNQDFTVTNHSFGAWDPDNNNADG